MTAGNGKTPASEPKVLRREVMKATGGFSKKGDQAIYERVDFADGRSGYYLPTKDYEGSEPPKFVVVTITEATVEQAKEILLAQLNA